MPFSKLCLLLFLFTTSEIRSQQAADTINVREIEGILTYLASDQLKGRANLTKEQLIAADFLGNKFKEIGLMPFPGLQYYYQPFIPTDEKKLLSKYDLKWNQIDLPSSSFLNLTSSLITADKIFKDYRLIRAESYLPDSILLEHWHDTTDILIWINRTFKLGDTLLPGNVILPENAPQNDILIVAAPGEPVEIELSANKDFSNNVAYNVIGVLPGNSKPDEAIIFSAHYDHLNMDLSGSGNKVFNGANDNASGTTAVLELAKYFSMRGDNARTIIFCLFAGEELGLLGSQQFVMDINPRKIKAVINIEMIGITNRAGKNAFFITGAQFSNLKKILTKNLKENKVKVTNEGIDLKMLFQRSDNYPFFLKGIPAHSIMCSDDTDPCYHKPCDDASRIDFENMARIIKAIAKSCQTLISGEDTPKLR